MDLQCFIRVPTTSYLCLYSAIPPVGELEKPSAEFTAPKYSLR